MARGETSKLEDMRAVRRRRPLRREVDSSSAGDLGELAAGACYVGSAEHKSHPSPAGPPRLRADATKCDPSLEFSQLTSWLQQGIRRGCVGGPWEGRFPRYVWLCVAGVWYEARLVNAGLGQYKGWQAEPSELPRNIKDCAR